MKKLLCVMLFIVLQAPSQAQTPEDPANGEAVPVDGGLSLLMAAGAALGGRQVHARWRKSRQGEGRSDV